MTHKLHLVKVHVLFVSSMFRGHARIACQVWVLIAESVKLMGFILRKMFPPVYWVTGFCWSMFLLMYLTSTKKCFRLRGIFGNHSPYIPMCSDKLFNNSNKKFHYTRHAFLLSNVVLCDPAVLPDCWQIVSPNDPPDCNRKIASSTITTAFVHHVFRLRLGTNPVTPGIHRWLSCVGGLFWHVRPTFTFSK